MSMARGDDAGDDWAEPPGVETYASLREEEGEENGLGYGDTDCLRHLAKDGLSMTRLNLNDRWILTGTCRRRWDLTTRAHLSTVNGQRMLGEAVYSSSEVVRIREEEQPTAEPL